LDGSSAETIAPRSGPPGAPALEYAATWIDEIDQRFARTHLYLSRPLFRQIPHPISWTERAAARRDHAGLDAISDEAVFASRSHLLTGDDAGDVLDALVHRSNLSDEAIRDQVKLLIGAGCDTSASSLARLCCARQSKLVDQLRAGSSAGHEPR